MVRQKRQHAAAHVTPIDSSSAIKEEGILSGASIPQIRIGRPVPDGLGRLPALRLMTLAETGTRP
jgi:hypothetical protein